MEGGGQGFDRQVFRLNFIKVPEEAERRIAFCLTLHDPEALGQTLAVLEEAHVRVMDGETGQEGLRFRVESGFSTETAARMARPSSSSGRKGKRTTDTIRRRCAPVSSRF